MEIDEWFNVIRVAPGGQADQMGVRPGFKMVAFNGTPTGSDSLSICMSRVRVTPRPWTFTFRVPLQPPLQPQTVPQTAPRTVVHFVDPPPAKAEDAKHTLGTGSEMNHNDSAVHPQQQQSYQQQMQNQAPQKLTQAAPAKDVRITKDGTLALTRPQINIANHVLTTRFFKPEMGAEQWTREDKETIVAEINRELVASQLEPRYTLQKLDQWQGNALYRYRCIQRNQKPESWQGSHARSARPMSAADDYDEGADSDSDDGMMESGWTADEIAE